MFVGVCVLLAIAFVLSRSPAQAGQSIGGGVSPPAVPNINAQQQQVNRVPEGTAPVIQVVPTANSNINGADAAAGGPVIQIAKSAPVTTPTTFTGSSSSVDCNCNIGELRKAALDATPPHIIECAAASDGESQAACHLPSATRYAALKQKGATLWMTGCSGAGKTTIATALEDRLVKAYGKHVYRFDI
jgi:hypothetical protein